MLPASFVQCKFGETPAALCCLQVLYNVSLERLLQPYVACKFVQCKFGKTAPALCCLQVLSNVSLERLLQPYVACKFYTM